MYIIYNVDMSILLKTANLPDLSTACTEAKIKAMMVNKTKINFMLINFFLIRLVCLTEQLIVMSL